MKLDSPTTSAVATVDATSKALRSSEYNPHGLPTAPVVTGAYIAPVRILAMFALHNFAISVPLASSVAVYIRRIYLRTAYSAAAATLQDLAHVVKSNGVISTASSTTITPIKLNSAHPASVCTALVSNGGALTFNAGGGQPLSILGQIRHARQLGSHGDLVMRFDMRYALELLPGETLTIHGGSSGWGGNTSLYGYILWEER